MDTRFASNAYRYFFIWGICASLATTVCTIVDARLVGSLIGNNGLVQKADPYAAGNQRLD